MRLYVDLDGVLTDFIGDLQKKFPDSYEGMPENLMWQRIHSISHFWDSMSWKSDGKALWNAVKNMRPIILSALTKSDLRVKPGKLIWLARNLPGVPKILVPKAIEKQRYARKDAILIDDLLSNIEQWVGKGGIGIWHHNTNDTLARLENILEGKALLIKKKGQMYELWSRDGTKKLFSSPSYATVVERERQVEHYKKLAREKKAGKK